MGRAADLYERLRLGGEVAIDEMMAAHQSESLFLDFKCSGDNGCGSKLHGDDWKNLAKAISGFGNSEGGVIVWGVDCRTDPHFGDVPTRKAPLSNPKRFVSWLEGAVSGCTVPAHSTVEHAAIESATAGEGFVVTLIPKSDLAPHQCIKLAGQLQYYIRAGSNFLPTPHAVLIGMFGRRPQPSLVHKFFAAGPPSLNKESSVAMGIEMEVGILLVSSGPGVCRDVYLTLSVSMPKGRSNARFEPQNDWIGQVAFGNMVNLVSREGFRLPPAFPVQPVILKLGFWPPFASKYVFDLTYGHAGGPVEKHRFELTEKEVESAYSRACSLLIQVPQPPAVQEEILRRFFGETTKR